MRRSSRLGVAIILLVLMIPVIGLADMAARKLAMFPPGEDGTRLLVTSGDLRIAVNNTDGRFTIGTSLGKSLLFGFPNEGATSHAHFFVNDTIRGTYLNDGGVHPVPATVTMSPALSSGSVISSYIVDGIAFTQRLTPTFWGDNATVLIEYTATNTSATTKQVGVLLFLDTMIGDNDYAPIATEYGYFAVEREFVSPNIPTYWQAFESSPWQPPDSLIGGGVLVGGSAVPPDRVVFGDFWSMHNVRWNYTLSGDPYSDSAVLFRWDAKPLAPGASRRMATYYGKGSAIISIGDLNLSLSAPDELSVESCEFRTPNPFPVNLIVSNATGTTIGGITARIDIPPSCELVSGDMVGMISPSVLDPAGTGTISWNIRVPDSHFENDTTLSFSASVFGTGTDTFSVEWTIDIPGIDGRGPTAEIINPSVGSITSCDTIEMFFRLIDRDGIDLSSIRVDCGSTFVFWPNPARLAFEYPYLRCTMPATELGEGLVNVGLRSIRDNNGCPIRGVREWSFIIDRQPPEVEVIAPVLGDTIYDEDFEVVVRLADPSGIKTSTLEWNIGGLIIPAYFDGEFARIRPVDAGITPTGFESWMVCLQGISDTVGGTCGANTASPACIAFFTNFTGPRAEIIEPLPGSYNSCANPKVEVKFTTSGEDIDPSTIRFEYNGTLYDISSGYLTYADSLLSFISPVTAVDGEEITVKLFASTFAGFPISPLNWTFISDRTPPEVSAIYPPDGVFITPDDNIVLFVRDIGSGLDLDSTLFDIEYSTGTRAISLRHTALIGEGDTLIIDLEALDISLERCGFVDIRISARDIASGCGPNMLSDFHYRVDVPCSPPNVGEPNIPSRTYISCDTFRLAIPLSDEEGLDLFSMIARFNGYLVPFGDLVVFEHDTLHLTIPHGTFGGDSVFIYVSPISDIFGNSASPVELVYHWDNEPPVFGILEPYMAAIIPDMPDFVRVEVRDSGAGIDIANCALEALGVTVTEFEGLIYDGSHLVVPTEAYGYSGQDSVIFRAFASDAVTLCPANFSEISWVVYFDQGSPLVEMISPPNGAIIGCESMEFVFTIIDENGVDASTIELTANGTLFNIDSPELIFNSDTIKFTSPTGLFSHGLAASVEITAVSDSIGNAISSPHGGTFHFDFEEPSVELISPDESILRGPTQAIVWHISDELAGIDYGSVQIVIQGIIYTLADPSLSLAGDILRFDPKIAGIEIDSDITIYLIASDLAYECRNQNHHVENINFTPAEIEVVSTSPSDNKIVSCDPLIVSIEIESDYGINIENAEVKLDEIVISPDRISLSGAIISIVFDEGEIPEGQHELVLTSVRDTIGNLLDTVQFTFSTDYTSPVVIDYSPRTGPVSPLELILRVVASDEIAGISAITARFTVDGTVYDLVTPELAVHNDTFVLDATNMGLAGDVSIIFEIDDRAELCGANHLVFAWDIEVSSDGPEFILIEPFDGAITHDRNQPIKIIAHDSDGLSINSVEIRAGSHIWDFDDMDFAGDTVIVRPEAIWNSGDTYQISISARDLLGNLSSDFLGAFIADFDPPQVSSTVPADRTAVRDVPQFITIHFSEDISGIDPASVSISVDDVLLEWGDYGLSFAQNSLVIDVERAGIGINKPDSVAVILYRIADYPGDYGPANLTSEEYTFSFIIMEEGCTAIPKPFSPNGDGWYDDVTIFTGEPEPTQVRIFTAEGVPVIERNAEHKLVWDGKDALGRPMKPGIYIYTVTRIYDNRTLCGGNIILAR